MARRLHHGEDEAAHLHGVAVLVKPDVVPLRHVELHVLVDAGCVGVLLMDIGGDMQLRPDAGHGGGMVKVPVGQQDADGLELVFRDIVQNTPRLRAGVDDGAAERV